MERGLRRPSLSLQQTLLLIRGLRSSPKRALDKSLLLHCVAGGAEGWTNSGGACDGRILNLRGHYDLRRRGLPRGGLPERTMWSAVNLARSNLARFGHATFDDKTKKLHCNILLLHVATPPLHVANPPLHVSSSASQHVICIFCSLLCSFLHCSFSSFSCNK